ncbi:MAG: oligosaccharide flippase family protein [Phenylobacterium sp.]|nr:oligosaccharide flippase family protein [Phenylobacterium sp.]
MRKGARAYLTANFVAQLCALLRFTILARLLGAEELGLAAILILTSQFFQSVSTTGADRFIIQDREGDDPKMQGLVQAVLAARGVLTAIALVLFSGLVAALFKAPELRTPLMGLALTPLILGFMHLDLRRVQRDLDFRPESIGILGSEIVALLCTAVAAWITRDASAVIWGLTARAIVQVAVSHLTAKRPYRFAFVRDQAMRFSHFAAPLFLNGILLFFGTQGDRVIVGNGLGAEALGHYSAALLLIFYPTTLLTRLVVGFYLPPLARSRDDPKLYAIERNRLSGRIMLLSLAMMVGFVAVAPFAMPLLYGPRFVEPVSILGAIAALQTLRFIRVWPTTVANSIGRSSILLYNNIVRIAILPLAIWAVNHFQSLEALILAFVIGEVGAMLSALWHLHRVSAIDIRRDAVRLATFLLWVAVVCAGTWAFDHGVTSLLWASAAGAVLGLGLLLTERDVVAEGIRWSQRRARRVLRLKR